MMRKQPRTTRHAEFIVLAPYVETGVAQHIAHISEPSLYIEACYHAAIVDVYIAHKVLDGIGKSRGVQNHIDKDSDIFRIELLSEAQPETVVTSGPRSLVQNTCERGGWDQPIRPR